MIGLKLMYHVNERNFEFSTLIFCIFCNAIKHCNLFLLFIIYYSLLNEENAKKKKNVKR